MCIDILPPTVWGYISQRIVSPHNIRKHTVQGMMIKQVIDLALGKVVHFTTIIAEGKTVNLTISQIGILHLEV